MDQSNSALISKTSDDSRRYKKPKDGDKKKGDKKANKDKGKTGKTGGKDKKPDKGGKKDAKGKDAKKDGASKDKKAQKTKDSKPKDAPGQKEKKDSTKGKGKKDASKGKDKKKDAPKGKDKKDAPKGKDKKEAPKGKDKKAAPKGKDKKDKKDAGKNKGKGKAEKGKKADKGKKPDKGKKKTDEGKTDDSEAAASDAPADEPGVERADGEGGAEAGSRRASAAAETIVSGTEEALATHVDDVNTPVVGHKDYIMDDLLDGLLESRAPSRKDFFRQESEFDMVSDMSLSLVDLRDLAGYSHGAPRQEMVAGYPHGAKSQGSALLWQQSVSSFPIEPSDVYSGRTYDVKSEYALQNVGTVQAFVEDPAKTSGESVAAAEFEGQNGELLSHVSEVAEHATTQVAESSKVEEGEEGGEALQAQADHADTASSVELTSAASEAVTDASDVTSASEAITDASDDAGTDAGEAATEASEASATDASEAATTDASEAATTDASEATTDASEATSDAGETTSDAGDAATDAGEATTDAGEATTDAGEATTDASASDVESSGTEAVESETTGSDIKHSDSSHLSYSMSRRGIAELSSPQPSVIKAQSEQRVSPSSESAAESRSGAVTEDEAAAVSDQEPKPAPTKWTDFIGIDDAEQRRDRRRASRPTLLTARPSLLYDSVRQQLALVTKSSRGQAATGDGGQSATPELGTPTADACAKVSPSRKKAPKRDTGRKVRPVQASPVQASAEGSESSSGAQSSSSDDGELIYKKSSKSKRGSRMHKRKTKRPQVAPLPDRARYASVSHSPSPSQDDRQRDEAMSELIAITQETGASITRATDEMRDAINKLSQMLHNINMGIRNLATSNSSPRIQSEEARSDLKIAPASRTRASFGYRYPEIQYVEVKVVFVRVMDIDTLNQNFEAEIYIQAKWTESQFAGLNEKELAEVEFNQCWDPCLKILNASGTLESERTSMLLQYEPNRVHPILTFMWYVRGLFREHLELQHFPFDVQELSVALSSDLSSEEIYFLDDFYNPSHVHYRALQESQDWVAYHHVEFHKDYSTLELMGRTQHPVLIASAHVKRRLGFYFWNVFIIVLLIIGLSICILAIDPTSTDRLGMLLTLFLTAVAFKLVVKTTLPTISYLTYLDIYVVFTLIYLALQACVSAMMIHLVKFRDRSKILLYDEISQALLISLVIIFHLVFLIYIQLTALKRRRQMKRKDAEHLMAQVNKRSQFQPATEKQTQTSVSIERKPGDAPLVPQRGNTSNNALSSSGPLADDMHDPGSQTMDYRIRYETNPGRLGRKTYYIKRPR